MASSSSSSSLNRIADTGLTRPFDPKRMMERRGEKKAVDKNVPRIGRPISNVCSKWRSNPPPPPVHYVRIHESVTLSLTKLAFTYASSIVRLGLEVPRAFWNDVVGRGRFSPGRLEYDRQTPRGLPPFISALANCPIILDGRWPIVSAKYPSSNFTRHAGLEKLQPRIHLRFSPPPPPIIFVFRLFYDDAPITSYDFSSVLVREKFEEIVCFRMDINIVSEKEKFGGNSCLKFWQEEFVEVNVTRYFDDEF